MTRRIFFFLLFILSQNAFGQSPHFKIFSTENGLPDAVLYTPFQDSKGYIWLSTSQGVVRYDGQKFQKFTTNDGLLKNDVWGFFEDNHGHLFFEMFFNDALQLQYFDLKTERIKTITLPKEKILFKKYKEYTSLNVANLGFEMLDSNTVCVYLERYAFANPASYFYAFLKVSESELKVVEPPKNLLDIFKTNQELRVNGLMAVEQITQNPAIQIFKAGIWQRFGIIPKIFENPRWEMNHIRICSDSTFAFGYDNAIELFNRSGKLLKNHTLPSLFKGFNAHKIVPFLSFSTQQSGVDILDNGLTQFPFDRFLNEIGIKAVLIDKQKNWWITTLKNELLMVSEQALKYSQTWPFNETVRHITKDPRGRTWIGTQSGKVFYKTENENWQEMFFKPTFKDYIRGLVCTPNGNLWIGNDIQLVKIDVTQATLPATIVLKPQTFGVNSDGNYMPFDLNHKTNFLVNSAVKSISMSKNLLISESNHTWEVTEDKAKSTIRLLINGKSYAVVKRENIIFLARPDGLYLKTDSLRRIKSIPAVSIGDVAIDSKGQLYVSPEEGGLYVYDIIRKKVVRNKLVGNGMVNKVVIDGDVAWVCSQSRGLIKLEQNKTTTFGLADGLPSVNVLDVLVEKDRLVIATGKGVTIVASKPPLPPEGGQ